MNKARSVLTVAAVVVVAAATAAGVWLADWRHAPSQADIRDGAVELVPAGADVTDETTGPQGAFPDPGPYRAFVEYRLSGDRADRVVTVRTHAEAEGWVVTDSGDLPGGAVLELEKGALTARLSILDSGHTRISTGGADVPISLRLRYAAVVLAFGVAALTVVWTASRRASGAPVTHRTTEPQRTEPPSTSSGDQHSQPPLEPEKPSASYRPWR